MLKHFTYKLLMIAAIIILVTGALSGCAKQAAFNGEDATAISHTDKLGNTDKLEITDKLENKQPNLSSDITSYIIRGAYNDALYNSSGGGAVKIFSTEEELRAFIEDNNISEIGDSETALSDVLEDKSLLEDYMVVICYSYGSSSTKYNAPLIDIAQGKLTVSRQVEVADMETADMVLRGYLLLVPKTVADNNGIKDISNIEYTGSKKLLQVK